MKRFSCLSVSALLVGLSLTTASVAFAAPDDAPAKAAPAKKPAKAKGKAAKAKTAPPPEPVVETVQDTTPPEGGGAPTTAPTAPADPAPPAADPTPAPAAATPVDPGASSTPTPAISIGNANGQTGADQPNGSGDDAKKAAAPRRWAGTQIFVTSSMTTSTFDKGQTQYNDPTVDGSIWLQPRFAINDAFQLRGLLVFSYEFTNADDTNTRNEPRFSDTTLSLFYRKIPEIPGGIKPAVSLNVGLPSSPESRAKTLIFAPGFGAQLSKSFEHVLGGTIDLLANGSYSHPVYRDTTPEIRGSAPYAFQCVGGDSCQDQLSGTYNVSDSIRYGGIVSGTWGKWSPALFYRGTSAWAYHGKDAVNPVDGTPVQSPNGFNPTHVRQASYFSAWIDYEANSWLTAEVGYWLERASAVTANGTYGNPFFDRFQDQRVFIGLNFNIDNIMKQLEGGPTEAGIVRAQNRTGPYGTF